MGMTSTVSNQASKLGRMFSARPSMLPAVKSNLPVAVAGSGGGGRRIPPAVKTALTGPGSQLPAIRPSGAMGPAGDPVAKVFGSATSKVAMDELNRSSSSATSKVAMDELNRSSKSALIALAGAGVGFGVAAGKTTQHINSKRKDKDED